jgi:hypothetical protein
LESELTKIMKNEVKSLIWMIWKEKMK